MLKPAALSCRFRMHCFAGLYIRCFLVSSHLALPYVQHDILKSSSNKGTCSDNFMKSLY